MPQMIMLTSPMAMNSGRTHARTQRIRHSLYWTIGHYGAQSAEEQEHPGEEERGLGLGHGEPEVESAIVRYLVPDGLDGSRLGGDHDADEGCDDAVEQDQRGRLAQIDLLPAESDPVPQYSEPAGMGSPHLTQCLSSIVSLTM